MSKARKIVDRCVDHVDLNAFDGCTIEEAKKVLDVYAAIHAGKAIYLRISYHEYSGADELEIWEKREENDAEYNTRMKREEKAKIAQQKAKQKKQEREKAKADAEYQEFLRLKEKYKQA